jgi:integrase
VESTLPIRVASHIHRNRHGTFYFRFVIPVDLRDTARRREMRFSLQTEQRHQAIDFALPMIAALPLLVADLRRMASENEHPQEDYFAKWREQMFVNAGLRGQINALKHDLWLREEVMSKMLDSMVTKDKAKQVAKLMHERGRLRGKDELEQAVVFPPPPDKTPLFSELLEAYLKGLNYRADGGRKKPPTPKTFAAYRADMAPFITIMGDVRIGYIDREVAGEYFSILKRLPANLNRKKEFKDKTISELLTLKAEPQSETNVSKKMERISTMFGWALEEKKRWGIDSNPFAGYGQADKKKPKRRPFTLDEVRSLLQHDCFTSRTFFSSYAYWLIPLGMFTGARLGELCQLELKDFVTVEGIDCIDINDEEETARLERVGELPEHPDARKKRVKTYNAKRLVPIHPELIRIGLLRHVGQLRQAGHTRLFTDLNHERRDGPGHAASNWFQRFRAHVGITEKQTTVFHSFRHLFITNILDAEVSPHMLAPIVGHEAELVTGQVYWNKRDATKRQPTVNTFTLPEDILAMIPNMEDVTIKPSRGPRKRVTSPV